MKIAVLRANALGDFIFVLPALTALRSQYPEAQITYLGCPWHKAFLDSRPIPIDRVLVVPSSEGVRLDGTPDEKELHHFFEAMRQETFDLAYQLHGGGRFSNPFVQRLGAMQSIGLQDQDAPPLDISIPYDYYMSEYLRYLEVVVAGGAQPQSLLPHVSLTPTDLDVLAATVRIDDPYVVLHPGASDLRRRWRPDHFARVGDWLYAQGMAVVISGTESELDVIEKVRSAMKRPAISVGGKLSLSGLVGLLSQAAMVVSNDTGPYHLAVALNTPAVGIFWCGNMINAAPLYKARHRAVAAWQTHCPLCGEDVATPGYPFTVSSSGCQHQTSFVESVTTSRVVDEVSNLIDSLGAEYGSSGRTSNPFESTDRASRVLPFDHPA